MNCELYVPRLNPGGGGKNRNGYEKTGSLFSRHAEYDLTTSLRPDQISKT
jgi:hypothetical protein